jgi:uncharacterized membrane protein YeaQ/YmgE (transglycosylase-associated protein family)
MDSANILGIISLLVPAAIAGWLAGILLKGRGFGLTGNIIVGVIGAVIGVFVSGYLHKKGLVSFSSDSFTDIILRSTIGSVILLFIISIFKK